MYAECARFVAGGGNYAALIGAATDYDRLAAKVRAVEQLDGNEEGVHVHVENGGVERNIALVDGAVLGAEASQVWHVGRLRLRGAGLKSKD